MRTGSSKDALKVVGPILSAAGPPGAVLASAWGEFVNDRRFKRVEEAVEEIRNLLSSLVDLNSFAATPESMQLLEHVLGRVESESNDKKRTRFCNLIASSWASADPVKGIFDEAMLFADATERFTDSHIAVLMRLYEGGSPSFNDLKSAVQADIPGEILLVILDDLCSRFAFAKRAWPGDGKLMISKGLSPEGIARGCAHNILDRGRRYVDFVIKGPREVRD